ncbi:hypothetical protein OG607_16640 [Streptomyces sp. NBC_01537]|uniref:hypothetical protein n=1 Tax=Streptomyces sp. NBC_01537 TaxID=2903896 RepID=UPI00386A45D0
MGEVTQRWKRFAAGRGTGLLLVVAGLLLSTVWVQQSLSETGFIGTHGTLTVERCSFVANHGSRRSRQLQDRDYDCTGTFVADGGGAMDTAAVVRVSDDQRIGTELSVQQSGGDYQFPGWTRALLTMAGAFVMLAVFAFGLFCLVTGCSFGKWGGPTSKEAEEKIKGTWFDRFLNTLYLAGGGGALLFAVAGGIAWL